MVVCYAFFKEDVSDLPIFTPVVFHCFTHHQHHRYDGVRSAQKSRISEPRDQYLTVRKTWNVQG